MALRSLLNQFPAKRLFGSPYLSLYKRGFSGNMADSTVEVVAFENLKDKVVGGKLILVDVREPAELKDDGKIPNSVNVPLGEVAEAFKLQSSAFKNKYGISKPDTASDLVISCRSGKRATNAYQTLRGLGYENISVYSGSFLDWVKNGGPVEK